jgi:hypothetical protein
MLAIGNVGSVAKAALQGTRFSISYANTILTKNAILSVFNGLGTASTAQTITISANPGFASKSLMAPSGTWRGITIQTSSQDVYAANRTTGYIYKQTGGVGPFVAESLASNSFYASMGTDIYGNIYASNTALGLLKKTGGVGSWTVIPTTGFSSSGQVAGDFLGNLYIGNSTGLYKQTGLTGSFVQVYSGNVASLAISPIDNSIYVTDSGATGTVYKQTAGTGSFTAVQNIPWASIWCSPSGDVYASNGTLYKQTAGTSSFVSMGISAPSYGGIGKSDGTLYAIDGNIHSIDFTKLITPTDRLIAINKGWTIA